MKNRTVTNNDNNNNNIEYVPGIDKQQQGVGRENGTQSRNVLRLGIGREKIIMKKKTVIGNHV